MDTKKALAIVASSYNTYFGGAGDALTPSNARKLSKGDKLGLLRVFINNADSELYSVKDAEMAFAHISQMR